MAKRNEVTKDSFVIKKAPSTMRLGSQSIIKGVPLVPLTEEIIMKAR